jgi:hypothetical protein
MAKMRALIDQSSLPHFLKEGRGRGTKDQYKPWLTVRDVPSRGRSSRDKGWTTGRPHHFLSTLELDCYHVFEWSSIITDIREQYPLLSREETLDETIVLAEECEIDHPKHPKSGNPIAMTTDFLLTVSCNGKSVERACAVKYAKDLSSRRTLEKLEIERRYWKAREINWGIITERDIPQILASNVQLLHSYWHLPEEMPADQIQTTASLLTELVKDHTQPLRSVTTEADRKLGFHGKNTGMSLAVAYYLIARREFQIDIHVPLDTDKPLVFLEATIAHF